MLSVGSMVFVLAATQKAMPQTEPLVNISVNGTSVWRTITSADGKWLALETTNALAINHAHLYATSGDKPPRFAGDAGAVNPSAILGLRTMSLSDDGSFLATLNDDNDDGQLRVFSLTRETPIQVGAVKFGNRSGHSGYVDTPYTVSFLAGSSLLAVEACDQKCTAWVYDADAFRRRPGRTVVWTDAIDSLYLGNRGRFETGGVWAVSVNPSDGGTLFRVNGTRGGARSVFERVTALPSLASDGDVVISADGSTLAVNGAEIYRISGGDGAGGVRVHHVLSLHDDLLFDVRLSRDGRYLAKVDRAIAYVHDLHDGGAIVNVVPCPKHAGATLSVGCQSVALSGDGRFLAAGGDRTLLLYMAPPSSGSPPPLPAVALLRRAASAGALSLCLDVQGDEAVAGAHLWLRQCMASRKATQTWTLHAGRVLVGDGSTDLCIDTGVGNVGAYGMVNVPAVQLLACEDEPTVTQQMSYRVQFAQMGPPVGMNGNVRRCLGPEPTRSPQTEVQVTLDECSTKKLSSDAATFDMYVF